MRDRPPSLPPKRNQHFRSLVEVGLNPLSRFNVLVGRNNASKPSILTVVEALSSVMQGRSTDLSRVITAMEAN